MQSDRRLTRLIRTRGLVAVALVALLTVAPAAAFTLPTQKPELVQANIKHATSHSQKNAQIKNDDAERSRELAQATTDSKTQYSLDLSDKVSNQISNHGFVIEDATQEP